ncbi:hypothetical protein N9B73_05315 [Verrucomicrobiales bacterium]|nr:hypothetical protein [Verrucomicrobiales bacterium]
MKPLAIFALFFPFALFAQDRLPNRIEVLTENYERAVERATNPITQKYATELKKLLLELTQKGDLAQAQQVEKKLRTLGVLEKTLGDILLSETWEYSANGSKSQIVFKDDGTAQMAGESNGVFPWKLEDELTLTLLYSDGNSCTFKFRDLETLSVEGKTRLGGAIRTLKPKE